MPVRFISIGLAVATLALPYLPVVASAKSSSAIAPAYHPVRLWYYTDSTTAKKDFLKHINSIDIFAPQTYKLEPDGTLSGTLDPELITAAKNHSVKIMPLVTNDGFSSSGHTALLTDPKVRAIAIEALITEAKNHGYYGWQFDFEQMDASYKDTYSAFVATAATALHEAGLKLSVAVVAKISDNPGDYPNDLWQNLIGVYDYDALGLSADFVSLMSYDDPTSKGPAVGWEWLQVVLAYALGHIPASKLSVGLATYYWARDTSTGKLVGIGGNEKIDDIFKKRKVVTSFDSVNKVPVMHYSAKGVLYSLWYENARSIKYKLDLIAKNKLYGFSAWQLGLEVPSIWAATNKL